MLVLMSEQNDISIPHLAPHSPAAEELISSSPVLTHTNRDTTSASLSYIQASCPYSLCNDKNSCTDRKADDFIQTSVTR